MKLFVALGVPKKVRQICVRFQHVLEAMTGPDAALRIEPESHFHMTVAFLGERCAGQLGVIWQAIDDATEAYPSDRFVLSGPTHYRELDDLAFLEFAHNANGQALWTTLNERLEELVGYEPQFPELGSRTSQ